MTHFNRAAFEKVIKEKNMNVTQVAGQIGINRSSLYRKMAGETEFKRSEIDSLCLLLNLSDPTAIFFTPKSCEKETK